MQNSKGTKEYGCQGSDYPCWGVWRLTEEQHERSFQGAGSVTLLDMGADYKGGFKFVKFIVSHSNDLCTTPSLYI